MYEAKETVFTATGMIPDSQDGKPAIIVQLAKNTILQKQRRACFGRFRHRTMHGLLPD